MEPRQSLDDHLFLNAQRESEALKERLLELYLLYTSSRTCSTILHPSSLFENVVTLLKNTLKVEEFSLMLENPENNLFEMWTADDRVMAEAGDCTFRSGEGISGLVVESGAPILVQDAGQDERFLHYKGLLSGIGSFLSVPLKAQGGRTFGVLNLHKAKVHGFRDQDVAFFQAVANNLAAAMERSQLYEKAQRDAMRDELTGIYNRRCFLECAKRELLQAERQGAILSLVMLDLDHFKTINDSCGHAVGDRALVQMARLLQSGLRRSDLVARYGGEEFVLLLPDTDMSGAWRLADKLRIRAGQELGQAMEPSPESITFTAGVASFPEDGATIEELFAVADRRLYSGKRQGRNQVVGAEQEANAIPGNRRSQPRYRAALRVVHAPGRGIGQPVHAIDIRHGDQWLPCALVGISRRGFNSLVYFEPQRGANYLCRAVFSPQAGEQPRQFEVQVRHAQELENHQYLMGVRIGNGDDPLWQNLYSSLT